MGMGDKITAQTAGYSGTPLAKKLGIKTGFNISLVNAPEYYFNLFTDLPADLKINVDSSGPKDFIHFFTKQKDEHQYASRVKKPDQGQRYDIGLLAEKSIESCNRHHRRYHPQFRFAKRFGRYQSLRRR